MIHKIHHLAVWLLVVIHFFVGLGWYALFGEAWLNYHARTMTDIEQPHSIVPYLIAIVDAVIINYTLAWLFARLHVAHALKNAEDLVMIGRIDPNAIVFHHDIDK